MTNPTPLSPAARAVWEAFNSKFDWVEDGVPGPQFQSIAAALRAAADQVVAEQPHEDTFEYCCDYAQSRAKDAIRHQLLAIAAELENTNG